MLRSLRPKRAGTYLGARAPLWWMLCVLLWLTAVFLRSETYPQRSANRRYLGSGGGSGFGIRFDQSAFGEANGPINSQSHWGFLHWSYSIDYDRLPPITRPTMEHVEFVMSAETYDGAATPSLSDTQNLELAKTLVRSYERNEGGSKKPPLWSIDANQLARGKVTMSRPWPHAAHWRWVGLVLYPLILAAFASTVIAIISSVVKGRDTLRLMALSNGVCPRCGYSLVAVSDARCPECGRALSGDELNMVHAKAGG